MHSFVNLLRYSIIHFFMSWLEKKEAKLTLQLEACFSSALFLQLQENNAAWWDILRPLARESHSHTESWSPLPAWLPQLQWTEIQMTSKRPWKDIKMTSGWNFDNIGLKRHIQIFLKVIRSSSRITIVCYCNFAWEVEFIIVETYYNEIWN